MIRLIDADPVTDASWPVQRLVRILFANILVPERVIVLDEILHQLKAL